MFAGAFVVGHDRDAVDGVVAGDVGEAAAGPGGVGGGGVGLGGQVQPTAPEALSCLAHGVQQSGGDADAPVLGVGDDVLDVEVVGVVLAAEGNDRADELVAVGGDRAGRGEQVGVEPVVRC